MPPIPATATRWPLRFAIQDETGKFSAVTYDRVVELTAWLCREFRLKPEKDVIRHYDVSGKVCPKYFCGGPEAWEQFLEDVSSAVIGGGN